MMKLHLQGQYFKSVNEKAKDSVIWLITITHLLLIIGYKCANLWTQLSYWSEPPRDRHMPIFVGKYFPSTSKKYSCQHQVLAETEHFVWLARDHTLYPGSWSKWTLPLNRIISGDVLNRIISGDVLNRILSGDVLNRIISGDVLFLLNRIISGDVLNRIISGDVLNRIISGDVQQAKQWTWKLLLPWHWQQNWVCV